jgi:hypothetical protein
LRRTVVEVRLTNKLDHETPPPTTASSPRWTPLVSPRRFAGSAPWYPDARTDRRRHPRPINPSGRRRVRRRPAAHEHARQHRRRARRTRWPRRQCSPQPDGGELRRRPRHSGACSIEPLFQSIEHRTNLRSIALPPTAPRSNGSLLSTSPQTSLAGTAGSSTRRRIVEFEKTEPPTNSY